MKLYGRPCTRSDRVQWTLEELKLPYDFYLVNSPEGELQSEFYLQRNPLGLMPTLEIDGEYYHESVAICQYLCEKEQSKLIPEINTPQRAAYLKWLLFGSSTLESHSFDRAMYLKVLAPEKSSQDIIDRSETYLTRIFTYLDPILEGQDTLLDEFSLADIIVGTCLSWNRDFVGDYPNLKSYLKGLMKRPTFKAMKNRQKGK